MALNDLNWKKSLFSFFSSKYMKTLINKWMSWKLLTRIQNKWYQLIFCFRDHGEVHHLAMCFRMLCRAADPLTYPGCCHQRNSSRWLGALIAELHSIAFFAAVPHSLNSDGTLFWGRQSFWSGQLLGKGARRLKCLSTIFAYLWRQLTLVAHSYSHVGVG